MWTLAASTISQTRKYMRNRNATRQRIGFCRDQRSMGYSPLFQWRRSPLSELSECFGWYVATKRMTKYIGAPMSQQRRNAPTSVNSMKPVFPNHIHNMTPHTKGPP